MLQKLWLREVEVAATSSSSGTLEVKIFKVVWQRFRNTHVTVTYPLEIWMQLECQPVSAAVSRWPGQESIYICAYVDNRECHSPTSSLYFSLPTLLCPSHFSFTLPWRSRDSNSTCLVFRLANFGVTVDSRTGNLSYDPSPPNKKYFLKLPRVKFSSCRSFTPIFDKYRVLASRR